MSNRRGSSEILIGLGVMVVAGALLSAFQYFATSQIRAKLKALNALSGIYNSEIALLHAYQHIVVNGNPPGAISTFLPIQLNDNGVRWGGRVTQWLKLLGVGPVWAESIQSEAGRPVSSQTTRNLSKQKTIVPRYSPGTIGYKAGAKVGGKTVYCGVSSPRGIASESQSCIELKEPPSGTLTLTPAGTLAPGNATKVTVQWNTQNTIACGITSTYAATCGAAGTAFDSKPSNAANRTNSFLSSALTTPNVCYTFVLTCTADLNSPFTRSATVRTGAYPPVTIDFKAQAYNGNKTSVTQEGEQVAHLNWNSTQADSCQLTGRWNTYCPSAPDPTIAGCDPSDHPANDPGNPNVGLNETDRTTAVLVSNRHYTYRLTCQNGSNTQTAEVSIYTYKKTLMYRMYNPLAVCHFFTADVGNYNAVKTQGYLDEGGRFYVFEYPFKANIHPVYRMYHPARGCHYYTLSAGEKGVLLGQGWVYEHPEGYLADNNDDSIENRGRVRHLYNANFSKGVGQGGSHIFSLTDTEVNTILTRWPDVWVEHAQLGYGLNFNPPNPTYPKRKVHRFFGGGLHRFTTNAAARPGETSETNDFCLFSDSMHDNLFPVFRLKENAGNHYLLTASKATLEALTNAGWTYEDTEGYAAPAAPGVTRLYRYYNNIDGDHLYATSNSLGLPAPWALESTEAAYVTPQSGGVCQ